MNGNYSGSETISKHWPDIKQQVRQQMNLSEVSYQTWIRGLALDSVNPGEVIIAVPSADTGAGIYIAERYAACFQDAIRNLTGETREVEFVLKPELMRSAAGR